LVTAIILLHLVLLHTAGSSNPLGINSSQDKISFYPYFFLKDAVGLALALIFYVILINFYPNLKNLISGWVRVSGEVSQKNLLLLRLIPVTFAHKGGF
jgi:quinol-cytochrome oxidoreductase complex cytochrome b subunit